MIEDESVNRRDSGHQYVHLVDCLVNTDPFKDWALLKVEFKLIAGEIDIEW